LKDITEDRYREFQALARSYADDTLKKIGNENYYKKQAKYTGDFKGASNDNTSSKYYQTIAKSLMAKIIKEANKEIEKNIKKKVFTKKKIDALKTQLQLTIKNIQNKYENDYGVVLNLDEIKVDPIKINLSSNVDLNISIWKSIKQFFNISLWGKEDKYIDRSAESWEEYANKTYKDSLVKEIKGKTDAAKKQIIDATNDVISEIINSVESQLEQELQDQKLYQENKQETIKKKEIVQKSFETLKKDYIAKAKEQNISLFK